MPLISPTSVVSFSSEDPNHPASNLLNRDTYRKWKCKDPREKEAFVILKFDKAVMFTGIDVGNESSAMIEVFVSRSGGTDVKYEVLLSSSVLMSPSDSRSLNNPCGVRSYSASFLDRETAAQKWDLVKVVVSQVFNKHTQYGLTFIKFTAAPDPDAPAKIGIFSMRKPLGLGDDDDDEESSPTRIGAMFAKRMAAKGIRENESGESSTSAAIREATKAISGAAQLSSEEKVKEVLRRQRLDAGSSPAARSPIIKKQSHDPSQRAEGSPTRNSPLDSPLGGKSKTKTNQSLNIPSHGSPKSSNSNNSNSPSTPSTSYSNGSTIKTKVGNQDRNGQLSFSKRTDKSLGKGSNLAGRKNNKDDDEEESSSSSSSRSMNKLLDEKNRKNQNHGDSESKSKPSSSGPRNSSSSLNDTTGNEEMDLDGEKERKPFGSLLEGVVFVMSGFQNPYRKNLRDRAIEMGAKCKPDWDSSCTHLICAFVNTPKFREVKNAGNGKIVKKEWIERSYGARCRFPWRRFCLDRNDRGDESEEEIYALESEGDAEEEILQEDVEEELPEAAEVAKPLNDSNGDGGESADDKEKASMDVSKDEIAHEIEKGDEVGKKKRKRIFADVESSDEVEFLDEESKKAAFEADTDVDEEDYTNNSLSAKKSKNDIDSGSSDTDFEESEPTTTTKTKNKDKGNESVAESFFKNSVFFISWPKGNPLNQRSQIEQIISQRKGRIEKELTEDVEILITPQKEWTEDFSEALSDNPNISVVQSDWILECERQNKMTSYDPFMILPS